jgi:hypothetical protein
MFTHGKHSIKYCAGNAHGNSVNLASGNKNHIATTMLPMVVIAAYGTCKNRRDTHARN